STVGTVTEIYDYLRLLFARVGTPHCPQCGRQIQEQSVDQIVDSLLVLPEGTRLVLLAPIVGAKKGEHQKLLDDARRMGYVRVRVDGEVLTLDESITLDRKKKHTIEIVVDRLTVAQEARRRLAESVESALETSGGTLVALVKEKDTEREVLYSQKSSCPTCGISIPELEPRLFSFNNPYGACTECSGLGVTLEFNKDLVVPDPRLSFNEGGIAPISPKANWYRSQFESLARHFKFSLDTPLKDLPKPVFQVILNGTDEKIDFRYQSRDGRGKWQYESGFRGILKDLRRRYLQSTSEQVKEWMEGFMSQKECEACGGTRLKPEVLAVTVGDRNIHQVSCLSVTSALEFFEKLDLPLTSQKIGRQIFKEINARLTFLRNVGLSYLTLERRASTLSGGEAQRIRLATQIGSSLVGVLYILDEPTIGLHQRDNALLIETLKHLRDIGNTLIVVEHDEQTLRTADYVVDLGPGAGVHGGHVVAAGTVDEVCASPQSQTGQYLAGALSIERPAARRKGNGKDVILKGATEHNLKNIAVTFPLGTMIAITGVSGSGKSTLLSDLLYPILSNRVSRTHLAEGSYDSVDGVEEIDKVINIDQSPIGRTPRSNPATYVDLFGPIRTLFAQLPDAKAKGYKSGRFSFNVKGGRCEKCQGAGTIRIAMHFLPDVYVTCDVCKGRRYNRETLDVRYKGKNIHEVLDMTVEEAHGFFRHIPSIEPKLKTLLLVGLGYVRLGQSALTLSGGEAQRVKLSLELSRKSTGKTFYILDEPTTGLHFADVKKLMEVLQVLVDNGNTIALIEHNLDVIACADHVIDLGPEGGEEGGRIIACGTPEQVARAEGSWTGKYLRRALKKE
ncbi:MAG TPA: excinuclease ABC subunit UvrA, partial [Spirochaetia bacterium]|nr:excinuclease ABC subunit UvrA [Spirochaetia bacterium]